MDGRVFRYVFREIKPKDFYWFSLVRNDYADADSTVISILILLRLLDTHDQDESVLTCIPVFLLSTLAEWVMKNLVQEKVMEVEQWLETGFHLCKERWDTSLDWLEQQPMSKILCMIGVTNDFNQKQNEEIKNAGKRR